MSDHLELESVFEILRGGFLPFRCGAEAFDYGQKIRFRVFSSSSEPLLSMSEMTVSAAQDRVRLEEAIEYARMRISDRGFALDPWKMPAPRARGE